MKKPLREQGVAAELPTNSLLTPHAPAWFAGLQRLALLQSDLALVPCGWGTDCKGPMLSEWQKHPGYSLDQLMEVRGIRSVGARTGILTGPVLCFDIDGATALELACSLGMEPWAVRTWQVHRDNDANRLKILFSPTPEQIALLPGAAEFQGKTITKPAVKGRDGKVITKGEALEVFFDGGRQVIVLGEHPSSGGTYIWPEGLGPEVLAPPPEAWWKHAVEIAQQCLDRRRSGSKPSTSRSNTSRLDPCPICGRQSGGGNGLWCEQTTAGLILCMPGSTFNADPTESMRIGTVINGYALVKRTPIKEGDCLTFAPHRPRRRHQRMPTQYAIAQRRRAVRG
jgi:hypothetical protein